MLRIPNDVMDLAAKRAWQLHVDEGMALDDAVDIAAGALLRAAKEEYGLQAQALSDLGQEVAPIKVTFAKIKEVGEAAPIKAVREAVSPWLWALSIIGFGVGLLNTHRITKLWKKWR